jgi:hypothetical protein
VILDDFYAYLGSMFGIEKRSTPVDIEFFLSVDFHNGKERGRFCAFDPASVLFEVRPDDGKCYFVIFEERPWDPIPQNIPDQSQIIFCLLPDSGVQVFFHGLFYWMKRRIFCKKESSTSLDFLSPATSFTFSQTISLNFS